MKINTFKPKNHPIAQIILEKIDSLKADNAKIDATLEEAIEAQEAVEVFLEEKIRSKEPFTEEEKDLLVKSSKATNTKLIKSMEKTLEAEVIEVPAGVKYLITDDSVKGLASPAGIHPDQRIFIKPDSVNLIACYQLPSHLAGLAVFNLDW